MSNPRYGSGRKQFVGQGIEADLGKLDPAAYPGAVAYSDGELYYSDGSEWVVPQDEVDIARPRNLAPTTSTEQSQLRLSSFRSPTGESQTGIIFEANADGLPDFGQGANLITRTVTSQVASMYQVVYPDDGFQPGDTIWWRARYLGTNGTQSQFSIPTAQVFPDLITTPSPVTPAFAVTGTVTVTNYDSPAIFALIYFNTIAEFYVAGAVPGVDAPVATVTHTNGATTTIPSGLAAGVTHYWRARYSGRVSVGSPVVTSNWSALRGVVPGGQSMILEYNLTLASARTIGIPLAGTVNVTVNWGDNITETFTTPGVKTHTYASGFGPTVLVSITGSLTMFGGTAITAAQAQGLTRVENWGFGLGLTSLQGALFRTSANLVFVSPQLPPTVTNLMEFMRNSTSNVDLSTLNTSNITNMQQMFDADVTATAAIFNRNIGGWDVSKVTNMSYMFRNHRTFNNGGSADIGNWNTSSVTDMNSMFNQATAFNQNIGAWNVSKVTNFANFAGGNSVTMTFNNGGSPTINNWDTSSATIMYAMFGFANSSYAFNQPVNNWNVSKVTNMGNMFGGSNVTAAFNQDLSSWNTSSVTDMGNMFGGCTAFNRNIGSWDVSKVTNMANMFLDCPAFNNGGSASIGNWNTALVTNMSNMFSCANRGTPAFNQPIGTWNTSSVTNMSSMFAPTNANSIFNQPIGNWDVSKVTNMSYMFGVLGGGNNVFNQDISGWNTSSVTNTSLMFNQNGSFNQPIGSWNLSANINFDNMFLNTSAFNQNVGGWQLRKAGISSLAIRVPQMNEENYSRTLIGWANYVATTDGPYTVPLVVTAGRLYNANAYVPGARFTNAAAARAFLVGGRIVSVTGSSDTNANTTYTYNGTTQTYDAANGWKFAILASAWGLYDASAVLQATGTGGNIGTGPHTVTSWTGVLSAATVLRTGAAWTITGDAAA